MLTDQLINLRTFLAPEIVYGQGALALTGRHARNLGAQHALLVTDPGVAAAGWSAKVSSSLAAAGIEATRFEEITPNPKDHEVMAGAAAYLQAGCDLIVAVGGGSPMDAAKGIGVVAANGGHISAYAGIDNVPTPGPPLVFIPTTAGTSADVSQFAIITDTRRRVKIAIISKLIIPDISLVDPDTTTTMPRELTAATGMDALCHAFEAYVSTNASPLTDMAAREAVGLIVAHLEGAWQRPDEMTHRSAMMMASLMAGLAFSNASLGLVHAMAHSLGGALDLAHGQCNALLLEKVVGFNFTTAVHKYRELAEAMGLRPPPADTEAAARKLMAGIAALRQRLEMGPILDAHALGREDLCHLATLALGDPCLVTNPRQASQEEVEALYLSVFGS